MNDDDFFFGEDAQQPADLKALVALANEALALEREVAAIEGHLKERNGLLNDYKLKRIPDAMAEAGLASGELKLDDGSSIKVEEFVSGSLPKEEAKRSAAITLLGTIGGETLIKNELSLNFEKREHNKALDLLERLRGEGYEPTLASTVHPQSLMAFVREKLRAGEEVDYETLGCFVGRKAKITVAKAKMQ